MGCFQIILLLPKSKAQPTLGENCTLLVENNLIDGFLKLCTSGIVWHIFNTTATNKKCKRETEISLSHSFNYCLLSIIAYILKTNNYLYT